MSAEYQLNFQDYLSILRRRALLLVGVFSGIFIVALAVALLLPPVYQSTGTILIESSQIPTEMVQATVTSYADERIEVIKQRVMTRENLLRIIEKYHLYKDHSSGTTPSELIDEMRMRIAIELVTANVQNKAKGSGTIAFKVSFEDRKPELANQVANELVTLFLDENVKVRTERANQTTEFLTQEADKLRTELETLENQIATFKQEHGNVLPDNVNMSMTAMQRTESELHEVDRDYKAAQEELRFLDVELATARAGNLNGPSQTFSPAQELERAKSEYARLSATYNENHPDVRAAKRKIATLESSAAASGGSGGKTIGDLAVAKVEAKIASARARVGSLGQQQGALRARMRQLETELQKAPQVERGLSALMRDHENAQKKYDEIRSKQMTAQVAENLEGDKKAERFSLLEPPLMPDRPIKPNRKKMIAMGFFLALAAALGATMVLENINGGVRGADALEAIVRQRPMAVIPYIALDEEVEKRKSLLKKAVIGLGVSIVVLLLVVHFVVMPLDVLVLKIIVRMS